MAKVWGKKMNNALIGYTGFVGNTLLNQTTFESLYRSTNISEIKHKGFDTVVCAGAPAKKWLANQQPVMDRATITSLIQYLKTIKCGTFILISTVDVFKTPVGVDENTPVDEVGLQAYGLNRRMLEKFVESHFPNNIIIRLPGLVGPGLRKNVIFDILNKNNLHVIDGRNVFQFYPMVNLWYDIVAASKAGLRLVHLTAEPISVAELSMKGFGQPLNHVLSGTPTMYNFCSQYAELFGAHGRYQYTAQETIQAVRAYAQSEPLAVGQSRG